MGNDPLGLGIDAAKGGLNIVEDWQHWALAPLMQGDDLREARRLTHPFSRSACQARCSAMKLEMK